MRLCEVPARPKRGFSSGQAREAQWLKDGSEALVARLPEETRLELAGGREGVAQIGGPQQAVAIAAAVLRSRAGKNGAKLFEVMKTMAYVEGYAEAMRAAGHDCPAWPVTAGMAWLLVRGEHIRATQAPSRGARGGASVGARLRDTLTFMESIRLPVRADKLILASAAPKAASGGNDDGSAATLPFKWECKLEWTAAAERDSPMRFWARSLLLCGVKVSLRVADGCRVTLALETDEITLPDGSSETVQVVSVLAKYAGGESKDGLSIHAYCYPEGFLGPFSWVQQHVSEVHSLGQAFPAWSGPFGAQKHFSRATELLPEVVDPAKIMRPLGAILAAGGLGDCPVSAEALKEAAVRGHSMHGTPSDRGAVTGEWPTYLFPLEERDEPGFSRDDVNELGHWLRLRGAKHDDRPADDVVRARVVDGPALRAVGAVTCWDLA